MRMEERTGEEAGPPWAQDTTAPRTCRPPPATAPAPSLNPLSIHSVTRFSNVHSLDLHFPNTPSGGHARIDFIGFKGTWQAAKREAVVAVYESAPVAKDHKVRERERMRSGAVWVWWRGGEENDGWKEAASFLFSVKPPPLGGRAPANSRTHTHTHTSSLSVCASAGKQGKAGPAAGRGRSPPLSIPAPTPHLAAFLFLFSLQVPGQSMGGFADVA